MLGNPIRMDLGNGGLKHTEPLSKQLFPLFSLPPPPLSKVNHSISQPSSQYQSNTPTSTQPSLLPHVPMGTIQDLCTSHTSGEKKKKKEKNFRKHCHPCEVKPSQCAPSCFPLPPFPHSFEHFSLDGRWTGYIADEGRIRRHL